MIVPRILDPASNFRPQTFQQGPLRPRVRPKRVHSGFWMTQAAQNWPAALYTNCFLSVLPDVSISPVAACRRPQWRRCDAWVVKVHILERPDCRDVSFSANTSAEIQTNILRCFPDGRAGCRDGASLEQVFRTYNSSPLQEVRKKLYFTRARVVQPSSCPCFDHTCTSFSLGWCENLCDPRSQRLPETGFRRARESESSQINTFPTHRAFS